MDRILQRGRYLVLLAVVATFAASAAAFLWGVWKTALTLLDLVRTGGKDPLAAISMIELMDKFLIAVGLYIFATGLYELFFHELNLPEWLVVHDLHGIKSRLSSVIILVMALTFLERLVQWSDPQGTLFFAAAIALVTAALIAFSLLGAKS